MTPNDPKMKTPPPPLKKNQNPLLPHNKQINKSKH